MKARVKATGEIVELCNMEFDEDGNEYYRDELELIGDYEPNYWEKLKHQYAGIAMQGLLSNSAYLENFIKYSVEGDSLARVVSANAIDYATALINKLKEEEK